MLQDSNKLLMIFDEAKPVSEEVWNLAKTAFCDCPNSTVNIAIKLPKIGVSQCQQNLINAEKKAEKFAR